jgi:phosphate transport system substrate-binding protein
LHLKRLICVSAATFGVVASAGIANASAVTITEAGSSLVYPLVAKWSHVYTADSVSAAAGGSSAGIADITAGSFNIGASDAPMTTGQAGQDSHNPVEIPWALSATDVVYNIPGIHAGLKLNASIVAGIYTGKITSWSSKSIVKLNPSYAKALKKAPKITPVFRSDGSGDSYVFQNFLFKGAPKVWGTAIPPTTSFPTNYGGQGENGNYGVSGEVAKNAGAIGYISAYYALSQHGLYAASLENAAGKYEQATGPTIQAAAASNNVIPPQSSFPGQGVSIQYPAKKYKTAYPIATYTYAIVNQNGESNLGNVKSFLNWAVTTGQKYGAALKFYPLPSRIVTQAQALINGL